MALKGCYVCVKYMVVAFNLIFWLVGLAVLAVTVWIYFASAVYLNESSDSYMYFTAMYILMAAGAVMFIIGLLGCCGALQESPRMLGAFFICLLVVFAAELTAGVWTWMHMEEVNKTIETEVMHMVKDKYGVETSVNNIVDSIQHDLDCCGAKEPSDWAHSRLNNKGNTAIEVGISKSSGFYNVPATCCISQIPEKCNTRREITFSGHSFEGLHSEGCIPKLQQYVEGSMIIVVGVAIGVGLIQILGLILSIFLCCAIRSVSTS